MATKKYVERYYSLSEPEMQSLISRAKRRDSSAQLQLLEVFANFLNKYTALLYFGKYTLKGSAGYDMRRFLALFVKDNSIRNYLLRDKLSPSGAKHVNEVVRGVNYMVQRYGDEEDVAQTVSMAFFECVEVYTPKEGRNGEMVPFSAFLYSYFFYKLKKQVDALLIDQLGRKTFPLITNEEPDEESDEPQPGFTAPPVSAAEDLIYCEEIDEFWVAGDTATAPFDTLSKQERQLLRWRYVDGERSSDIAARITEHPNTVREHFNRIKSKVREQVLADLSEE